MKPVLGNKGYLISLNYFQGRKKIQSDCYNVIPQQLMINYYYCIVIIVGYWVAKEKIGCVIIEKYSYSLHEYHGIYSNDKLSDENNNFMSYL